MDWFPLYSGIVDWAPSKEPQVENALVARKYPSFDHLLLSFFYLAGTAPD
jgi:hypothetical protein